MTTGWHMAYGLGIDLGTTFTAAAVSDSSGTRAVPLSDDITVSSVVFAAEDGTLLTGDAAVKAAAKDPTRASYAHKRRLGDPKSQALGGVVRSPASLMAAQLRDVVKLVTAVEGAPPGAIVLTCPAVWGPYRREIFSEVPRLAGLRNVRVITEPEAAATHYSVERRLGQGALIAVYDLGGGTFDTTILRALPSGMEILGTPEGIERMGGIDFDDTLLAHVDTSLNGAISELDPSNPQDAVVLAQVHARCVKAKEGLSTEPDINIRVPLQSGEREVVVTRRQFNQMINPSLDVTIEALERTLSSAKIKPDDLAGVVLAGGSSHIPLVGQIVSKAFGKPVHVTLHPKLTVALGAAATARADMARAAARPAARPAAQAPVPGPSGAAEARTTQSAATNGTSQPGGDRAPVATLETQAFSAPKFLVPPPWQNGRPSQPVPPRPRKPFARIGKTPQQRGWIIAAAVALVVLLVGTTLALVVNRNTETPGAAPTSTASSPAAAAPASGDVVLDFFAKGEDVGGYESRIAAAEAWEGVAVPSNGTVTAGPLSVTPGDVSGTGDGRHLAWSGEKTAQYYLQSPGNTESASALLDNGALVFDVVVQKAPSAEVTLAAHCRYPCAGELRITQLLRKTTPGKATSLRIPLSCFKEKGLDPAVVDTPFLLTTPGKLDISIGHVRWERGGTNLKCADVH